MSHVACIYNTISTNRRQNIELTAVKVPRVIDVFKAFFGLLKNLSQSVRMTTEFVELSGQIDGHFKLNQRTTKPTL